MEQLLVAIQPPPAEETVPLLTAAGRIAARDVTAGIDQPPFDRSPLDGYAVRHSDIAEATKERPVILRVTARTWAGDPPAAGVLPGEAVQIATGAPLPAGATCVIRAEDTGRAGDSVRIFRSHGEGENICLRGEDVRKGRLLLRRGERIDSPAVGVLAGQGKTQAAVFRKPAVGVLSTGAELLAGGETLRPGKIYDSNQYYLAARLLELGATPVQGKRMPDHPGELTVELEALLECCDLVLTTGGVSVGERDCMPAVGERMGCTRLFHGIDLKPGGPALALLKNGKLVLCLSGNPFAAAATFELLAAPVVRALAGLENPRWRRVRGLLQTPFHKASPGRRFVRAKLVGGDIFLPEDGHASGSLSALSGCNCLIDIPAGSPGLAKGMSVEAVLF